ncbi:MAG: TraR/DksA family transcriptional regulator [Rhizobiales bacterium]|nr:TraR/DksA family transcriptional regulator [Hyphomicrobiales bacterium]
MADEVDRAQELELRQRNVAVAALQAKLNAPLVIVENCIECDDEIEPERRAVMPSARRCIECEQRREQARRQARRRLKRR